nr:hypothetical protein [Anaerolineae bacterium]
MAHNSYEVMMSLALDALLTQEEEKELNQHLQSCSTCAQLWDDMTIINTMFTASAEVAPPANFSANVLARVESYESGRRWYPWIVGVLVAASVIAASLWALPALFLSLGLPDLLAEWPVIGEIIDAATRGYIAIQIGVSWVVELANTWFSYLLNEPASLAVILTALVLASTWIGLLEGIKATRNAAVSSQTA